jgi:hypothetical protein
MRVSKLAAQIKFCGRAIKTQRAAGLKIFLINRVIPFGLAIFGETDDFTEVCKIRQSAGMKLFDPICRAW